MHITTRIQVRFSDMDMAHHANNSVYLVWFELGRMDLFRQFIPKHHDWRQHGVILAHNEVDHRVPVHLGDRVEVETWCSNVGTKSFELQHEIWSADRLVAEAKSVLVGYDYERNESVPLSDDLRRTLTP